MCQDKDNSTPEAGDHAFGAPIPRQERRAVSGRRMIKIIFAFKLLEKLNQFSQRRKK